MALISDSVEVKNKSITRENQRLKEIIERLKNEIINLRNINESNVLINFCPACKKFYDANYKNQKWVQ